MWVTVWRHGEAAPGNIDEFRALTARGRQSLSAIVPRFTALCANAQAPAPDTLAFSPLVRTTQTAEIITQQLGLDPQVCPALAPGADLFAPSGFIDDNSEHQVLVSHQPFVSQLLGHWLDDPYQSPLMPGGFACVKLLAPTQGGGELLFIQPEIF